MPYFFLKILHIMSGSLLIGSWVMNTFFTLSYNKLTSTPHRVTTIQQLTAWDVKLSLLCLILQPLSGFAIIAIKSYDPLSLWVLGTVAAYTLVGLLWLTLLFQQQRLLQKLTEDPELDLRTYHQQRGWLLFTLLPCLFVLYYLMIHRPS